MFRREGIELGLESGHVRFGLEIGHRAADQLLGGSPFEAGQRRVRERKRQVGVVARDPLGLKLDDGAVQVRLVTQRPVRHPQRPERLLTGVRHAAHRDDGGADQAEQEQKPGGGPGSDVVDEADPSMRG